MAKNLAISSINTEHVDHIVGIGKQKQLNEYLFEIFSLEMANFMKR